MPPARGADRAVVILVLRGMGHITSTALRWMERYAKQLNEGGGALILADVSPAVMATLKNSGVLKTIGEGNAFPATARVLEAEETAWQAAQKWLASPHTAPASALKTE
jgi:anti-anti-sigma regulatory factor